MAVFRYKMQNILNIKEKLETQEKMAYSLANARLAEEQEKLEGLLLRRAGYQNKLKEMSMGDIDVLQIKTCKEAIETIKLMIKNQMIAVQNAQRNVEIARRRLEEAQQERKMHEKLKEKALETFLQEENKAEMKQIDELTSFTYGAKALESKE